MTKKDSGKSSLRAAESIRLVRRSRAKRLALKLGVFVLAPTLLAGGYLWAFSSDAYESVALFSIQAAESRPSMAMESLIGIAGVSSAGRDTLAARDFVLSREMMDKLDASEGLLQHYRSTEIDLLSRLRADESREDAHKYYLDRVQVSFDSNSTTLTLRVKAYTAQKAHKIAQAVLAECEKKVNLISEKARQDQIKLAESDVTKAEKRLSASREEMVALQQKHGQLSPLQSADAAMTVRTGLEAKLAEARAEHSALSSYMSQQSPQVVAAQQRVSALAAQVKSETRRLVDSTKHEGLHHSLAEFESVQVEKEFATQAYQSAMGSLEMARAEAARQHRYLAVIAEPSRPDEAMYPRRILLTFTTFISALVLFGIASLGIAAVKEHARL